MANTYTGKIEDQDPNQLMPQPAVSESPGFIDRIKQGVVMDFPGAPGVVDTVKRGVADVVHPELIESTKARWNPHTVENINAVNFLTPKPRQNAAIVRDPGAVLPATSNSIPTPAPRNYLAEVETQDRMFNAERDTPRPPAVQANYVPEVRATMTNPWEQKAPAKADPGLVYAELVNRGRAHGDMSVANQYEKTLLEQIHSMLPGASPKEVRSIMTTINQSVRTPGSNAGQTGQPDGSLSQAVAKAQAPAPNYQKLGAGQSIYQMQPDGTARLITTAPGGATEQHKNDTFKQQQTGSMHSWDRIKKEYDKNWDKITENVADGPSRELALRKLNTDHFKSLGIPDELADVPVSFTSFLNDITHGTKISRQDHDRYAAVHKMKVALRNKMLKAHFGNTLTFE